MYRLMGVVVSVKGGLKVLFGVWAYFSSNQIIDIILFLKCCKALP